MSYQIRAAARTDLNPLQQFINSQNYLHRHLDWRDTLDWLGRQPFLLLEEKQKILGAFACPPEPEDVAWLRLFGVCMNQSPDKVWQVLLLSALEILSSLDPHPVLVSLALREWYNALLQRNGFHFHQDIIVFMYDHEPPLARPMLKDILLRPMAKEDLPGVGLLDNLAFEPIWRLSNDDLLHAYLKGAYMTIAEKEGQIIAYQMSSSSGFYAHLSRLAVHPELQRQGIGYALVQDLLEHYIAGRGCWGVTLNTQHNNSSSIALYHRIGFRETGERFPVFVYPY